MGVVGPAGEPGRNSVQTDYLRRLTESQIVVTCNPEAWEGDSRLFEALASGALVLCDRMMQPPPGVVGNRSVVWYSSIPELIGLLHHFIKHPHQADAIAARGREAAFGPEIALTLILKEARLNATRTHQARIFVVDVPDRSGEFETMNDGIARSDVAVRVYDVREADALLLDLHRAGSLSGGAVSALDPIWHAVLKRRARGERCVVIGLDWGDISTHLHADPQARIDFYFKRSTVDRAHSTPQLGLYPRKVFPMFYPLKASFRIKLDELIGDGHVHALPLPPPPWYHPASVIQLLRHLVTRATPGSAEPQSPMPAQGLNRHFRPRVVTTLLPPYRHPSARAELVDRLELDLGCRRSGMNLSACMCKRYVDLDRVFELQVRQRFQGQEIGQARGGDRRKAIHRQSPRPSLPLGAGS